MRPFGKCGNCGYREVCEVETETNAKIIECVYRDNYKKDGSRYGISGKSQKRPKKDAKTRGKTKHLIGVLGS